MEESLYEPSLYEPSLYEPSLYGQKPRSCFIAEYLILTDALFFLC